MDRASMNPFLGPAVDAAEEASIARILAMVDAVVHDPPLGEPPAYLKMSKLPAPSQYDGADDIAQLEIWLNGLLEYVATLSLTGPGFERDRVRILGLSLKGEASVSTCSWSDIPNERTAS